MNITFPAYRSFMATACRASVDAFGFQGITRPCVRSPPLPTLAGNFLVMAGPWNVAVFVDGAGAEMPCRLIQNWYNFLVRLDASQTPPRLSSRPTSLFCRRLLLSSQIHPNGLGSYFRQARRRSHRCCQACHQSIPEPRFFLQFRCLLHQNLSTLPQQCILSF